MLTEQISYYSTPSTNCVVGIFYAKVFSASTEIGLAWFEMGQSLRVVDDVTKEVEDTIHFRMIRLQSESKNLFMQFDDGPTNTLVCFLVTRYNGGFT
jgi:hypothetical protein